MTWSQILRIARLRRGASNMDRMDQDGLVSPNCEGPQFGEKCRIDLQVAINEGNRRRDAFFVVKIGKSGIAMPFQQSIPLHFAKYHVNLYLETVTLEAQSGCSWKTVIRALRSVVRFGKGWKEFSVENHLRQGYQLLFNLVGKTHFVVQFFDDLGHRHTRFPPLTPVEAAVSVEPSFQSASEPTLLGMSRDKPENFLGKHTLDSEKAKVILRQFFTQARAQTYTKMPKSKFGIRNKMTRALEKDTFARGINGVNLLAMDDLSGMETEPHGNQGTYEEHAREEGEAFLLPENGEDDDLHLQESPEKQDLSRAFTKKLSKRDFYEGTLDNIATVSSRVFSSVCKDDELYSGKKIRFQSPKKGGRDLTRDEPMKFPQQDHVKLQKNMEQKKKFSMTSKTCKSQIVREQLEKQKYASDQVALNRLWRSKRDTAPSKLDKSDNHHDALKEVAAMKNSRDEVLRDTSERIAVRRENSAVYPSEAFSPAKRLLQQQRCMNFSQIISKCRRRSVTNEGRSRAVNAAKKFAFALEHENFVVVMNDAQVYHGFQLAIPLEFLQVTGTLQITTKKVCLTDMNHTFYDTNWWWHTYSRTPLLNSDGWAYFALDHMLEEGDVCVFELVDSEPSFFFLVHIFPVVEISMKDCEVRGGQPALNQKFGERASPASDLGRELEQKSGKNGSALALGRRPRLQRRIEKPHPQSWTKLFKPKTKDPFKQE